MNQRIKRFKALSVEEQSNEFLNLFKETRTSLSKRYLGGDLSSSKIESISIETLFEAIEKNPKDTSVSNYKVNKLTGAGGARYPGMEKAGVFIFVIGIGFFIVSLINTIVLQMLPLADIPMHILTIETDYMLPLLLVGAGMLSIIIGSSFIFASGYVENTGPAQEIQTLIDHANILSSEAADEFVRLWEQNSEIQSNVVTTEVVTEVYVDPNFHLQQNTDLSTLPPSYDLIAAGQYNYYPEQAHLPNPSNTQTTTYQTLINYPDTNPFYQKIVQTGGIVETVLPSNAEFAGGSFYHSPVPPVYLTNPDGTQTTVETAVYYDLNHPFTTPQPFNPSGTQ